MRRIHVWAWVAAMGSALLGGCQSDTRLSGDVFIVTQGGQNVKLGLVSVYFIPQDGVTKHFGERRGVAKANLEQLEKDRLALNQEMANLQLGTVSPAEMKATFSALRVEISSAGGGKSHAEAKADLVKDLAELNAAQAAVRNLEHKIGINEQAVADTTSECFLAAGVAGPSIVEKSDADGKFEATLNGGKYLAVASASRSVGGKPERYCWMVWVEAKRPEQKLMLSNDNLAGSGCAECGTPPKTTR